MPKARDVVVCRPTVKKTLPGKVCWETPCAGAWRLPTERLPRPGFDKPQLALQFSKAASTKQLRCSPAKNNALAICEHL